MYIVVVRFRAGGKAVEEGRCGIGGPFDAGGFFRRSHPAARGCSDDAVAVDVARAFRFDISPALRAVVSVFRMDFCCGDTVNVVGGAESVGQACAFAFSVAYGAVLKRAMFIPVVVVEFRFVAVGAVEIDGFRFDVAGQGGSARPYFDAAFPFMHRPPGMAEQEVFAARFVGFSVSQSADGRVGHQGLRRCGQRYENGCQNNGEQQGGRSFH